MNELMLREIHDQPRLVAEELARLREESRAAAARVTETTTRVILTGCGDSWIAGLALESAIRSLLGPTRPVHVVQSLEAARYFPFGPGDLLVAGSVSGGVARTIEAVEAAQRGGALVVGMTARPDSKLGALASAVIRLPEPIARNTPHSRDYLGTLLALATFFEAMAGQTIAPLDTLADLLSSHMSQWEQEAWTAGEILSSAPRLFLLGAGPSWANAIYGAAKFWEAGGLLAIAQEIEEFAHGPHMLVRRGDAAILVAPSGPSGDRAARVLPGLSRLGVRGVIIADNPAGFDDAELVTIPPFPDLWSPFITAVPLQLLCYATATFEGLDVTLPLGGHPDGPGYQTVHMDWTRGD